MKRLAILLPLFLAACATKEPTQPPAIAPTVKVPAPSPPVDLKPLRDAVRPIEEANRQFRSEIERQRAIIYELNLAKDADGKDDPKVLRLRASNDELARIASDQANRIEEMDGVILDKTIQVEKKNREIAEAVENLGTANQRIVELTAASADLAKERNDAEARNRSLEDDLKEKKRALLFWRISTAVFALSAGALTYLLFKPRFL